MSFGSGQREEGEWSDVEAHGFLKLFARHSARGSGAGIRFPCRGECDAEGELTACRGR